MTHNAGSLGRPRVVVVVVVVVFVVVVRRSRCSRRHRRCTLYCPVLMGFKRVGPLGGFAWEALWPLGAVLERSWGLVEHRGSHLQATCAIWSHLGGHLGLSEALLHHIGPSWILGALAHQCVWFRPMCPKAPYLISNQLARLFARLSCRDHGEESRPASRACVVQRFW